MNPAIIGFTWFMYVTFGVIAATTSVIASEPTNVSWAKAILWPYFFVRYVKRGLVRAIKSY